MFGFQISHKSCDDNLATVIFILLDVCPKPIFLHGSVNVKKGGNNKKLAVHKCEESRPLLDGVRECLSDGSLSGSEPDCQCMFQFSASIIMNTSVDYNSILKGGSPS